jgi:peptidoglycan biosynthesis protein MviN/MurJ (putative lipid II flippase)
MAGFVLFPMVGNVLTRVFYVTKDTRTVPIVTAASAVVYIFLARGLSDLWGYVGLALAIPLHRALGLAVLYLLLLYRFTSFRNFEPLKSLLGFGIAAMIAFFAGQLAVDFLSFLPALIPLLAGLLLAGLVYIACLFVLDREIALSVLEILGVQRALHKFKVEYQRLRPAARG